MKTQISILVKDESQFAKSAALKINRFKKSEMNVIIDGNEQTFTASKKPYVLEVEPGHHLIEFKDPKEETKRKYNKGMMGFLGFIFGLGAGVGSAVNTATVFAESGKPSIKENKVEVVLQEGDILKLSCKADSRGRVKVKQI